MSEAGADGTQLGDYKTSIAARSGRARSRGRDLDRRGRGARRIRHLPDHEPGRGAAKAEGCPADRRMRSLQRRAAGRRLLGLHEHEHERGVIPVGDRNNSLRANGTGNSRRPSRRATTPTRCRPLSTHRPEPSPGRCPGTRRRHPRRRRRAIRRSRSGRSRSPRTTRACSSCASTTPSSRPAATGRHRCAQDRDRRGQRERDRRHRDEPLRLRLEGRVLAERHRRDLGAGTKVDGAVAQGDTVVCTFTNTRKGTPPTTADAAHTSHTADAAPTRRRCRLRRQARLRSSTSSSQSRSSPRSSPSEGG